MDALSASADNLSAGLSVDLTAADNREVACKVAGVTSDVGYRWAGSAVTSLYIYAGVE